MKKTLLLTLALLLSVSIFAQNRSTLLYESFEKKALPEGWSIFGGGNKNWSVTATDKAGGTPNELDLFWDPVFNGTTRVAMKAINLTGIPSIVISFKHYLDYYSNTCTIGVATSSDNGTTWNSGWKQSYDKSGRYVVNEVIETADMGKENVLVCIYFEGTTDDINSWQFDDILIFKQEELDAEALSIDTDSKLGNGYNDIAFTVRNLGKSTITSFTAKYQIEDEIEFVEETFETNIETYATEQFTFKTPLFVNIGKYKLNVEITSVNGNNDQYADNNINVKNIEVQLGTCQRFPMIEHFSSSTCYPCVFTNQDMDTLTMNNPDKYTYVKYPMPGPGTGDPYYTSECGTRRSYYNVNNVPMIFLDGKKAEAPLPQEKLDKSYNTTSFIDIRGSFKVNEADNTITVIADVLPYANINNAMLCITVNEKTTTKNIGSNGETEFHHIMMKMLPSSAGTKLKLEAGKSQRFEFTHDMSETNMEELNDLEVAIWIQNSATKEIYNSRFAYEYSDHVYPARNLNVTTIDEDPKLKLTWDAPEGNTPDSYYIYIDGKCIKTDFKELTFIDHASALNVYDGRTHYIEIVAIYSGHRSSVSLIGEINDVVNIKEIKDYQDINIYPNPTNDRLYIETENEIEDVVVYDIYGRRQQLSVISGQPSVIDVADLKSGIYFVKINTNEGNIVKRIIKK